MPTPPRSGRRLVATVSFSSFELLDVSGGAGRDSFQVTPDANLAITISGGGPLGGNAGDALTVNRSGTTNAKLTANPSANGFSGTWSFNGIQTITFNGIERVTPEAMALACAKTDLVAPLTMFKAIRTQMDELGPEPDYRIHALAQLPQLIATHP